MSESYSKVTEWQKLSVVPLRGLQGKEKNRDGG